MSKHLSMLGALALSGCSLLSPPQPTVTPVYLADASQRGFYIECSAITACLTKADQTCPQGYQEIDRRKRADNNNHISSSHYDPITGFQPTFPQAPTFTLTIQCPADLNITPR